MKKPDRVLNEAARRVISAHASTPGAPRAAAPEAMQRACSALYRVLETTLGTAGLEALIGRAIQIATRDYPWLRAVTAGRVDGCPLSGLTEAAAPLDAEEAAEGSAALLASIVWLLCQRPSNFPPSWPAKNPPLGVGY